MKPAASLEERLARLLGGGSLVSLLFMVVGFVLFVARHAGAAHTTTELVRERGGDTLGARLILIGVALLIATPVCRVLVTFVVSVARRDRVFVVLNLVVLVVIAVALWLGHVTD